MGKDPDKKKKSYRKKQNRNLGQNGTAPEAIEKVRCIFKINIVGRYSDTCVSLFFHQRLFKREKYQPRSTMTCWKTLPWVDLLEDWSMVQRSKECPLMETQRRLCSPLKMNQMLIQRRYTIQLLRVTIRIIGLIVGCEKRKGRWRCFIKCFQVEGKIKATSHHVSKNCDCDDRLNYHHSLSRVSFWLRGLDRGRI